MKWCQRRIGGRKIVFHLVRSSHPKLEGCDGLYHPDEGTVYLDRALEKSKRNSIFIHEVKHIIRDISGSNNVVVSAIPDEATREHVEEQQVRCETPMWQQFLEENGFQFPKGPGE